jgi:hypothetical protein
MVSLNTKQDGQPPKTPFFKGTKTSLNGNVINIKIEKKMVMYLQKRKRNCDLVIWNFFLAWNTPINLKIENTKNLS